MKLSLARILWTAVMLPVAATAACGSNRDLFIGSDCDKGVCDAGPTLTAPPADGGDVEASPGSVPMCPVTTCSLPWATCASSKFPCDADLSIDNDNCGACGVRCGGPDGRSKTNWSCVDGKCAFNCNFPNNFGWLDCDDDPSNGCEVYVIDDVDNCGTCGQKCAAGLVCYKGTCVQPCEPWGLPDSCDGTCTDLSSDDKNCGTCGTICDPTGPDLPALPTGMHYGCVLGSCRRPKCDDPLQADCNGDLRDGCEATLHTNEHCSSCADVCPSGKVCNAPAGQYRCLCDDGETYCGFPALCRRLDDDPLHCGGCNHACPGQNLPFFVTTCSFGVCAGHCADGHADCDGILDNGCEVSTRVDNRNCGGCGIACAHGQVCSEGKCLVTPCEPEGRPTQ